MCCYLFSLFSAKICLMVASNELELRILLADDDKEDYHILKEASQKVPQRLKVDHVKNWLELLRYVSRHSMPSVILLDLNMPVRNGIECLQLLRKDQKFEDTPILIYSTSNTPSDIDSAFQSGANYYIIKPSSLAEITRVVEKIAGMNKNELLQVPTKERFVLQAS